jgi:hypothetical protein
LFTKTNTKHTTATQQTKSVKWNDNKRDDFVNIVHNQHSELTSIISDLENIQLSNEGSQQDVHTSSIVIDRYSNFGNTYWSKEFARVLGPGQIVTSLEHLAQCRDVQVTSLCGLGLTHVRLFWQINISKSYTIHTNKSYNKCVKMTEYNYENIHHKMRSCYLTHKKNPQNISKKIVKSVASLELEY